MLFVPINRDNRLKVERLYEKYRNLMYWQAYDILKDKPLAEDAVHQSFIKIINSLDKIDENNNSRTKSFLVIVCRNVALTIYNKRSINFGREAFIDSIEDELLDDENTDPLNILVDNESVTQITEGIEKLPKIYRDVIVLKGTYDCSQKEIAQLLEITVEAVKKRLYRARKRLSETLEKEQLK